MRHTIYSVVMTGILMPAMGQAAGQASSEDSLSRAEAILNRGKPLVLSNLAITPLKKQPKNLLAGRQGKGTLNSRDIFIEFGKDGETVSAWTQGRVTTEKPFTGKYTMTGDLLDFVLGPSTFSGVLNGNRIVGMRKRSDGIRDGWELNLE